MSLSENTFEAQYQVEDGYVTGERLQTFKISAEDLEHDASEDALREFYGKAISQDFLESGKVYPSSRREDRFIAWAKAQIAERKAAEPQPLRMALDLLNELELINELELVSAQAEAVATALRQLGLDPAVLEQLQPGAGARAHRITCRLETAAEAARGLCPAAEASWGLG